MSSLLDLLKQKKAAIQAGQRKKTLKLGDGRGRYRILPSWREGSEQFWHDFGQHFVKNAAGEMQAVYICSDKTFGKPCAVCDAVKHAIKSATDDATMELLKDAQAAHRIMVNAIHLDGPSPTEVQILELPPTVFGQIVAIMEEWVEAGENPLDIAAGKDFIIERTGKGKNTKYTTQVAAKTTVLSKDVLTRLHNLDEWVAQENAEGETRALNGIRAAIGLPAPSARPSLPSPATTIVEDEYEVAVPPARRAAAPAPAPAVKAAATDVEFEDVPDVAVKPATKPAPAPAPVAESTGDADLDALLSKLG